MLNTNKTNRIEIADIQAPESTLTEAEAQNVTGGGTALTWGKLLTKTTIGKLIGAFQFGYELASALGAEKLGNKIGDALAKK